MQLGKAAIVGIIGSILALVGFFLPWVSIPGISLSGMALAGGGQLPVAGMLYLLYLVPVFGIIGLIVSLVPIAAKMKNIATLVSGILAVIPVIYFMTLPGAMAFAGYGLYLSLIGAIILLVAGIMGFTMKE